MGADLLDGQVDLDEALGVSEWIHHYITPLLKLSIGFVVSAFREIYLHLMTLSKTLFSISWGFFEVA